MATTKAQDTSNLTPAQLADLDRALTPAEQARVDAWQEAEANAMGDAEEAKGGPKAVAVTVTPQGAVIKATPAPESPWKMVAMIGGAAVLAYWIFGD